MEIEKISTSLLECVERDDVDGARRLLVGIDEQDRKLIVAKRESSNAPLFVAAMRGNVDMVEFLVKECLADTEELGRLRLCDLVTPLCCAAASDNLNVLNLLIDLGANINALSYRGSTPVLYACKWKNIAVVKCLVKHGADVNKSDNDGDTCLMIAVGWNKELCQFLIDNGAEVKTQNSFGNSALHCAIISDDSTDKDDIVQLLIDHGSDPYMKNRDGEDAFQTASLQYQASSLEILLRMCEPQVRRAIELYELFGAHCVQRYRRIISIEKVLPFWRKAVEMRRINSCFVVNASPPNSVSLDAQEVHTVEELETLCQDNNFVYNHALKIYERVLGPEDHRVQAGLLHRGLMYRTDGEFRRSIHIFKYAFQMQNLRLKYIWPLLYLCYGFWDARRGSHQRNDGDNSGVDFEEVFEVLNRVTSDLVDATETIHSQEFQKDKFLQLIFMQLILHLVKLIVELDKNEDQQLRFNKVVYRLVRYQPKTQIGQTLLHLSVKHSTSQVGDKSISEFPSIAVVELLLECGAKVNAVDDEHNTALHLCSKAIQNLEMQHHHDMINRIAALLLKNEAHLDMINIFGDKAAEGLTSCLMEMNIQDFDSLKCLAARAVGKNKIPYVGIILASLEPFVQMHGI